MPKSPTSIRLKPEILAYVDEQADKRGWSRSAWISWLVQMFRTRDVKRAYREHTDVDDAQ